MSQGNVELIEQLVAVFNERGIEATREFCHPVVEFFTEFDSAWESHRSEPLEIRAVGEDKVLLETVEHFVGRDGVEVEAPFSSVHTIRDGKVLRWQGFWKRGRALEALGLTE